jgi:hypothetical protein
VQWVMHIANEINEELEHFLCQLRGSGHCGGWWPLHKVGQDRADIMDRIEDVDALFFCPAIRTREATIVQGVVASGVDEVQLLMCGNSNLLTLGTSMRSSWGETGRASATGSGQMARQQPGASCSMSYN